MDRFIQILIVEIFSSDPPNLMPWVFLKKIPKLFWSGGSREKNFTLGICIKESVPTTLFFSVDYLPTLPNSVFLLDLEFFILSIVWKVWIVWIFYKVWIVGLVQKVWIVWIVQKVWIVGIVQKVWIVQKVQLFRIVQKVWIVRIVILNLMELCFCLATLIWT